MANLRKLRCRLVVVMGLRDAVYALRTFVVLDAKLLREQLRTRARLWEQRRCELVGE